MPHNEQALNPQAQGQAVPQDELGAFGTGLQSLTPEEVQELDILITPRLAQLLTKIFPPAGQFLQPFVENDVAASIQAGAPIAPDGTPHPQEIASAAPPRPVQGGTGLSRPIG